MIAVGLERPAGRHHYQCVSELADHDRAMDEVIRRMPAESSIQPLALGSNQIDVVLKVVTRQMLPGMVTAILIVLDVALGTPRLVL